MPNSRKRKLGPALQWGSDRMSFWNETFYFEKHGDRYVYRPTVFSEGFDISESEKDHLVRELKRLIWRFLLEGGILIALTAGLFMTGVIETQSPIPWFMVSSVVALAALAVTVFYRRDRLVEKVLGRRAPDVPRLPSRQALAKPRPLVTKRYAIPVLQSAIILFGLTIAAGDGLVLYVIVAAFRSGQFAEGPEETAAAEALLSLTASNTAFWAAILLFNAALFAGVVFLILQVRRLRAAAGFDRRG